MPTYFRNRWTASWAFAWLKSRPLRFIVPALLFLLTNVSPSKAQSEYFFNAYTKKDGLYHNTVRHILQDQYGFVWLGTDNGLHRFDGQEIVPFRFDIHDPNSLSGNHITCLYLDREQQLWVGTDNGLNRLNREKGHFERIPLHLADAGLVSHQIKSLLEDSQGNLWIGTYDGLLKLSWKNGRSNFDVQAFSPDHQNTKATDQREVHYLAEDDYGFLWVIYPDLIDRINLKDGTNKQIALPFLQPARTRKFFSAALDKNGHIVTTVFLGKLELYYLDPSDQVPQLKPYLPPDLLPDISTRPKESAILFDQQDRLWMGTPEGIYLINASRNHYRLLRHQPDQPGSLSNSDITTIYEGQVGSIWVGTRGGGFNRGKSTSGQYQFYQYDEDEPNSISQGQIRTIVEDREGYLWVGHLDTGIDKFAVDNQKQLTKVQTFRHDPSRETSLVGNSVILIYPDRKGNLWIGTNGQGLNKLDPVSGAMEAFLHDPDDHNTISGNRIWGICEDRNGYIWVGDFFNGLNRIDPVTKAVKRYKNEPGNPNSLSLNRIKTMFLDSGGKIWIGTNNGLNRLDPETETFTQFFHEPDNPNSLSNSYIFSIFEDRHHQLWVGTSLGLNRLRPSADPGAEEYEIERFYELDGLPSNTIYSIQDDHRGNIWIGTTNGLARLLPTEPKYSFTVQNNGDGLENAIYLPKAHYRNKETGWLYFGNDQGLLMMHPDWLEIGTLPPKLVLNEVTRTQFQIADPFFDYFIDERQSLHLTHKDQILTMDLSDLNWNSSRKYEYRLTGFNDQWIKMEDNMEITFTQLHPGDYSLIARSRDLYNVPQEEVHLLDIEVAPPWWESGWAYFTYILGLGMIILGLHRFQLRQQLEKRETENLRALNEVKNKVYTDITHEFKTPLTVISGMADQIRGQSRIRTLIKDNSANLINLVNQILELRRLEIGYLKLELIQGDIVLYLRSVISSYEALAELRGIKLHFLSLESELFMDFDREKLLRVVSNLLSNAIKFTPSGGDIYVELHRAGPGSASQNPEEMLELNVLDTGMGIPEADQPYIFDRYYRISKPPVAPHEKDAEGTGIGLALTKELIVLMGGEISLESRPEEGAKFRVLIPIRRQAPIIEIKEEAAPSPLVPNLAPSGEEAISPSLEDTRPEEKDQLPTLLVIEDNPDLVEYLTSLLEDHYTLLVARDGQEGLDIALDRIPDLILSDVMMPKKDGFEVCSILKKDERTSHIPIVLLTAKTSTESRIQGLERGADAYLAKPFDPKELFVRLKKLKELRQMLQARYQSLEPPVPAEEASFRQEDAFMAKLRQMVEDRMNDPEFNTTQLCREIGMSRTNLHLKIKALTNKSTSEFINAVRLQKARQLLLHSDLNVNEVAYDVGYKDPSYFSRKFTETYGINPSKLGQNRSNRE